MPIIGGYDFSSTLLLIELFYIFNDIFANISWKETRTLVSAMKLKECYKKTARAELRSRHMNLDYGTKIEIMNRPNLVPMFYINYMNCKMWITWCGNRLAKY